MAKSKLLTNFGHDVTPLVIPASAAKKAPSVANVKPFGSLVLIEQLNPDEVLGTSLYVNEKTDVGAPQGYVVAIGPSVKLEEVGLKIGDRVLLQGSYVPAPEIGDSKRKLGLVELHNIKAILVEETK